MSGVADPNETYRRPVVALHGFTQTGACIGPLGRALAATTGVWCPDLPGHGDAAGSADLDLWATASELAEKAESAVGTPAVWVGYSLGGRVALHVALSRPERVSALVLIGATAGIADDDERRLRASNDARLAEHIVDIGVEAFVDEWLAGPLFAGLPSWARFDRERRRNTAAGLAGSLRNAGTGSMDPLWDSLPDIEVPVMCLSGERDQKFTDLAARMVDALPCARHEIVSDAGHAVHLERPGAVIDLVVPFCARQTL